MPTYSYSKLGTFDQCKLRYKYQYIDRLETEVENTVEAFMGDLVHRALEKLYKDLKFQKMNSLQDLLDYYNDTWAKEWNDAIVIVRKDYESENFRKMGEKFITDYYNRFKPFDQDRTIGLETMRKIEIEPGFLFHIRVNRLAVDKEGVYEIHDYKTSNSLPTQEDAENNLQLAIYAYGVKKMYPDAKKTRLIWHYLAFDKDVIVEKTNEELEEIKNSMVAKMHEAEACTEFPAQVSALCDWCLFRQHCPKFKHLYELEDKNVEEFRDDDGVKLANEYTAISEKAKKLDKEKEQLKDRLVNFAKKKDVDTVYGSDVKVSIYTYPRLSFPKKDEPLRAEFLDKIKELGLWEQLAQPDVYSLAKMINNREIHADLVNLLERFIDRGETIRIYVNKK